MAYIIKKIDFETFKNKEVGQPLKNRESGLFKIAEEYYTENKEKLDNCINSVFLEKEIPPEIEVEIEFQVIDSNNKFLFYLKLKIVNIESNTLSLVLLNVSRKLK